MKRRSVTVLICAALSFVLISCGDDSTVEEPPHALAGAWQGQWSSGGASGSVTMTISPFNHLKATLNGGSLPSSGAVLTGTITPEGKAQGTLGINNVTESSFTGTFSISGETLTGTINTTNNETLTFDLSKN